MQLLGLEIVLLGFLRVLLALAGLVLLGLLLVLPGGPLEFRHCLGRLAVLLLHLPHFLRVRTLCPGVCLEFLLLATQCLLAGLRPVGCGHRPVERRLHCSPSRSPFGIGVGHALHVLRLGGVLCTVAGGRCLVQCSPRLFLGLVCLRLGGLTLLLGDLQFLVRPLGCLLGLPCSLLGPTGDLFVLPGVLLGITGGTFLDCRRDLRNPGHGMSQEGTTERRNHLRVSERPLGLEIGGNLLRGNTCPLLRRGELGRRHRPAQAGTGTVARPDVLARAGEVEGCGIRATAR